MRMLLKVAIVGSLLVVGSPQLVVAHQVATPGSGPSKQSTSPAEESFTLTDAGGVDLAAFTIVEIQDPPEDIAAGFIPAEGMRVVAVAVRVENTGQGPFEVRPDHVLLQDTDGYIWPYGSIQREPEAVIPNLSQVVLAPGDRISGIVGYQVPAQSEIARVLLRPESNRLLVLSDVRGDAGPAPEIGAAVEWTTEETGAEGTVTVMEYEDPFDDAPAGTTPPEGMRYVLVTLAFENTGSAPLDVRTGTILLQDDNGYVLTYGSVPRGTDIVIPDLQSQQLAPGSRISGVVGFQVPIETDIASVVFQPESGRLILLADVESGM